MLFLKLVVDFACGALDAWGGHSFIEARRYIMPFVLGLAVSVVTHTWWAGLMILPIMGTLCLGYFSGSNWGRALWLFLQAVIIGIGLTLTGHLTWYFYVPYILGAGILGGLYKNWQQLDGDFITGCWLGSIIFLVR